MKTLTSAPNGNIKHTILQNTLGLILLNFPWHISIDINSITPPMQQCACLQMFRSRALL